MRTKEEIQKEIKEVRTAKKELRERRYAYTNTNRREHREQMIKDKKELKALNEKSDALYKELAQVEGRIQ